MNIVLDERTMLRIVLPRVDLSTNCLNPEDWKQLRNSEAVESKGVSEGQSVLRLISPKITAQV